MRGARGAFYGSMLAAALCASVWVAAPASSAVSAKPTSLKLLINGKQLPITPFTGPDRYTPIKPGKLRVVARWRTSLTGTGYRVVISTTEPYQRTYRTCTTGTVCVVPKLVPIFRGQEMSWTVRIMKVRYHQVTILGGFMVCLVSGTTAS